MHLSIGGQCDANHRMRPRNADLRRAGVPHRGRGSSGSWKRRRATDGATGTSPWYSSPTGTAYGLPSWSTSTGLPSSTPNGPLGCHPRRGPADRRQRRRGLAAGGGFVVFAFGYIIGTLTYAVLRGLSVPRSWIAFPSGERLAEDWPPLRNRRPTRTANRRRLGTTSRKSSTLLLTASTLWIDKPVTLLPGRARLATSPLPTESPLPTNTIGMTDIACLAAIVGGVAPLNPSVNQPRGPEREARGRLPVCTDRGSMHKAHDPKESATPHVTYRAIATPPVIRSTPPTRDRPVRQCLLPQYPFRCPSLFWRGARQQ